MDITGYKKATRLETVYEMLFVWKYAHAHILGSMNMAQI